MQGFSGCRRHSPSKDYDIVYELNVSGQVLGATTKRLMGQKAEVDVSFAEILPCAKVWLSFTEIIPSPLVNLMVESSLLVPDTPASPTLSVASVDTLVDDMDFETDSINLKLKLVDSDVLPAKDLSLTTAAHIKEIQKAMAGSYKRVFGPVHPNGPPRRRRRSNIQCDQVSIENKAIQSVPASTYIPAACSVYPSSTLESTCPWFENGTEYDLLSRCF